MELQGKTALVTGGAHRVGRAIVIALAHAGAKVAVNYNTSAAEAAETVTAVQQSGGQAVAFQADVGNAAAAHTLVDQTAQHFGSLDLLVNNASTYTKSPVPFSESVWRRTMDVILDGAFHCANAITIARPTRCAPPVTNAVLPFSSMARFYAAQWQQPLGGQHACTGSLCLRAPHAFGC